MLDTIVSRQVLALPPPDEGTVALPTLDGGTGVREMIAGMTVAFQVGGTAGHLSVTVVDGDTVTHQDDEGVGVAQKEVIGVDTLQEIGDVGDHEVMVKQVTGMGIV